MAVNVKDICDVNKRFVSPKGTLEPYAYLNRPDYGRDHFVNERGQYKCNLTYSIEDQKAQQLMKFIDDVFERNWELRLADHNENPPAPQRGKKPEVPYKGEPPYIDNGDGTVTFFFSAWASYLKDGEKKPINLTFADSRGRPVKSNQVPNIWSGSELRASFKLLPYGWSKVAGAGVKLQLQGIMLIDVRTGGGDGAEEFAEFAEEEGGFEAGDYQAPDRQQEEVQDDAPWEGDDEALSTPQGSPSNGGDF